MRPGRGFLGTGGVPGIGNFISSRIRGRWIQWRLKGKGHRLDPAGFALTQPFPPPAPPSMQMAIYKAGHQGATGEGRANRRKSHPLLSGRVMGARVINTMG